jgi:hypothetical protein
MDDEIWEFVSAAGDWVSKSYSFPPMTGRVLGWLLVCDPPEQTAAQLAQELDASVGAISNATGMLTRLRMIERIRVRGERADRFRIRPELWGEQLRDSGIEAARSVLKLGMRALAGAPPSRRARLEELDAFYAWFEQRSEQLYEEWQQYREAFYRGKLND